MVSVLFLIMKFTFVECELLGRESHFKNDPDGKIRVLRAMSLSLSLCYCCNLIYLIFGKRNIIERNRLAKQDHCVVQIHL